MALDLDNDEFLSAAIDCLPKVLKLIGAVPKEKRSLALAVAQQSYLQTAQALGYEENDARQWVSTIMSLLEIATAANEWATGKMTAINETKRISTSLRGLLFPLRQLNPFSGNNSFTRAS
jgi:hypothetical protein